MLAVRGLRQKHLTFVSRCCTCSWRTFIFESHPKSVRAMRLEKERVRHRALLHAILSLPFSFRLCRASHSSLGVGFGTAVLVGNPVGSGILPGKVAGRLPSTGPVPQRAQD